MYRTLATVIAAAMWMGSAHATATEDCVDKLPERMAVELMFETEACAEQGSALCDELSEALQTLEKTQDECVIWRPRTDPQGSAGAD